eukprot:COSAG02_NODE_32622_length_513_cov_0.934783_1_plen_61_part_00
MLHAEIAPEKVLEVVQVMGREGKLSLEERGGYRSFSVTQAAYKLLAMVVLELLEEHVQHY